MQKKITTNTIQRSSWRWSYIRQMILKNNSHYTAPPPLHKSPGEPQSKNNKKTGWGEHIPTLSTLSYKNKHKMASRGREKI